MTIALRPQHHSDWLARLRTIGLGLSGRGVMGLGVGRSAVSAAAPAAWYLAGGAPAPVAVWQPIGAASLAASYLRIAGTAGHANIDPAVVGGVAPTFDAATGWTTNGSNQYLTTGITSFPTTGTWIIRCSDGPSNGTTAASPLGLYSLDPSARLIAVLINYYGSQLWANTSAFASFGAPLTGGVFGVADRTVYQNGASVGTLAAAGAVVTDRQIYLGAAQHPISGLSYAFPGKIQAVAFWDTSTGYATWMPAVMAAAAAL